MKNHSVATHKSPLGALVLDGDDRLAVRVLNLERPVLHVLLEFGFIKLATNKTLGVKDRVTWVRVESVLGRVADETLFIRERDPRWSDTVTLVVGDNLDTTVTLDTKNFSFRNPKYAG
jgi:hypothetical protein